MNFLQKLFTKEIQKKSYTYSNSVVNSRDLINNLFRFKGGAADNQLIEEGYVSNADLYSIISTLCEIGSDVPFLVEQKTADGWELDEQSKLNDLINKPNEYTTGKDFRYNSLNYLLNTGDIFWYKTISSFDLVTETTLFESNLIDLLFDAYGEVKTIQYSKNNTTQSDYLPDEIIHNMYLNPSISGLQSKRGLSPLQAGYAAMISSNNRGVASASMLENGGAANLISSGSEMVMTEDERKAVQDETDKKLGGSNKFGKNVVTTAAISVNSLGMSSQQMQMLEGTVIDRRSLCNIFKVDSSLFNDKDASTYNNMQTVSKAVYTRAVIPNNNKIISGYSSIIPAYNSFENKELRIVQDLSNIEALPQDQLVLAEKNSKNFATAMEVLKSPISEDSKNKVISDLLGVEIEMPEQETAVTGLGEENVQVQSLNGAQVTSMVTIVQGVQMGTIPKESAKNILMVSFGMDEQEASKIINPIVINKPTATNETI